MFRFVSEPDDVDFVVYEVDVDVDDEEVDERRIALGLGAVLLSLLALLVVVVAVVLLSNDSHSARTPTYPAIRLAPGRTVGDDRSLAEVYARKRVLRALDADGLAAPGARIRSSCSSTNPHDLGGGQSWDCAVRSPRSRAGKRLGLVVHVREDARGDFAGQLERIG
jgi:hypothetical protein